MRIAPMAIPIPARTLTMDLWENRGKPLVHPQGTGNRRESTRYPHDANDLEAMANLIM